MWRILELVKEVTARYPEDEFFSDFELSCNENHLKRDLYLVYENALVELADDAWVILKEKAVRQFTNHRPHQLKTGFFAQLNEAFAYNYLTSHGYRNVVFLREGKTRQADLQFKNQNGFGLCEVKTIGISDNEIDRRTPHKIIDGSVYARLSEEFIGKLRSTIDAARTQIGNPSKMSLVYVVIEFDDFTHDYLAEYRKQLQDFVSGFPHNSLILQIDREGDIISA